MTDSRKDSRTLDVVFTIEIIQPFKRRRTFIYFGVTIGMLHGERNNILGSYTWYIHMDTLLESRKQGTGRSRASPRATALLTRGIEATLVVLVTAHITRSYHTQMIPAGHETHRIPLGTTRGNTAKYIARRSVQVGKREWVWS